VVDTNGAGDAFMAGFLAAWLRTEPVGVALRAAAEQARIAIETVHLHPALGRREVRPSNRSCASDQDAQNG
jgi:sugar/nucleoside kinase (ribokinase family)